MQYAVCDRKHDVIAMVDDAGALLERVRYTAYGEARHMVPSDFNRDGQVDGADQGLLFQAWSDSVGDPGYEPEADLNRDGTVDSADNGLLLQQWGVDPTPPGGISGHGNTIGYSGYIYDEAVDLSLARFRWYSGDLGRWVVRDPIRAHVEPSHLGTDVDYVAPFYVRPVRRAASVQGVVATALFDNDGPSQYSDGMNLYLHLLSDSIGVTDSSGLESEHDKNKRKSTKEKHEEGQSRKRRDQGLEKGDKRRQDRSNKRNNPNRGNKGGGNSRRGMTTRGKGGLLGKMFAGSCISACALDLDSCLAQAEDDLAQGIETAGSLDCPTDRERFEDLSWDIYHLDVASCSSTYSACALACLLPFDL